MLVSGVSRGGDEIKLIQYQKMTKLNAKIPSLFSCQEGGRNFVTGYCLSLKLSVPYTVHWTVSSTVRKLISMYLPTIIHVICWNYTSRSSASLACCALSWRRTSGLPSAVASSLLGSIRWTWRGPLPNSPTLWRLTGMWCLLYSSIWSTGWRVFATTLRPPNQPWGQRKKDKLPAGETYICPVENKNTATSWGDD